MNYLLKKFFGLEESIFFLGDNTYFRGTLVVTDIWKNVGWSSIIYLATISGIDPSLYEAAACDGATRLQSTFLYHAANAGVHYRSNADSECGLDYGCGV